MSKASTQTYIDRVKSGKLKSDKDYILKFIIQENSKGCDLTQMLDTFTIKQSNITARLSELTIEGLIFSDRTIDIEGSKYSVYHFEPNESKQKDNAWNVENERFKRDVKGLLNKYDVKLSNGAIEELTKLIE